MRFSARFGSLHKETCRTLVFISASSTFQGNACVVVVLMLQCWELEL